MERLYILRHGIAVPEGTEGIADDDRPLTPKGEKRMRQIGLGLRRLVPKLDKIVTSPLPRARRTAEIVAEALKLSDLIEVADVLRSGTSAEAIRDWLSSRPERRLLIVGHNPSLTDLIGLLATGHSGPPIVELRKGGIAAFAALPEGWRLDWLGRPRLIRRLVD